MSWQISPEIVWLDSDDEIRLYDPTSGQFRTLNATGTAIWRAVAAGDDPDVAALRLSEQFHAGSDAQRRAVAADVREFVDTLATQGLLVASS